MRLGIAVQSVVVAIGALSLTSTTHGFIVNRPGGAMIPVRTSSSSFAESQGWDNDNFLDSLSGGSDDIDAANQQYTAFSKARAGRQESRLAKEEQDSSDAEAEEEEGQGGTRFKEMMARSEQAATGGAKQQGRSILYNPMEGINKSPNSPPPPSGDTPDQATIEEQARMFREFMQNQQQGQAPAPSRERPGAPKKVGRNRDADTIANKADLYFAQLKRDSTVRTLARDRGDVEKANTVFEDEEIKELENLIQDNPYIKEQQGLLETSADEMIAVMKMTAGSGEKNEDENVQAVSYKDRLKERKKKKQGGTAPQPQAASKPEPAVVAKPEPKEQKKKKKQVPQPQVVSKPEPAAVAESELKDRKMKKKKKQGGAVPKPQAASKPEPAAVTETKVQEQKTKKQGGAAPKSPAVSEPVQMMSTESVPESAVPDAPVETQSVVSVPESSVPSPPDQQTQPVASESSTGGDAQEENRRKIRTLMGLILKHRGGPGMGSGRLKSPEAKRFETVLSEVTEILRSEAPGAAAAAAAPPVQTTAPTAQQPAPPAQAITPPAQQMAPPAQQMPAPGQQMPIPAATASPPGTDPLVGTLACVEGAVQIYKNSPPETQEALLGQLRGALMSAVNTCNQVIAHKEVENVQAYRKAVPLQQPAQSMSTTPAQSSEAKTSKSLDVQPSQFFEVKPYTPSVKESSEGEEEMSSPDEPVSPAAETRSGTDENSKFLQRLYEKLVASAGKEKFGLGNLSPDEAAELADQVGEMKGMLIEELESGIPEPDETSAGDEGSSSKYKEMLAKAKAEKAV